MAATPETPPIMRTAAGDMRRVGVEIEYIGVDARSSATLVQKLYGGNIVTVNPHRYSIVDTRFGDFGVELDMQYAHVEATADAEDIPPGKLQEAEAMLRETFGDLSQVVVPVEVVGPPMDWQDLGALDDLVGRLRIAGARGTDQSVLYAFGLQLNPELPALDATTILRYLQAYIAISPDLHTAIGVDFTRRILPYVDQFPDPYVRLVLDPKYAPDLDTLIDDYLAHNDTRNRELDMLPLFAFLDDARVRAKLDDPLIKSRPTFHYRLPNCRIADPDWGVLTEWSRWLWVEKLAEDPKALRDRAAARRAEAMGLRHKLMTKLKSWGPGN